MRSTPIIIVETAGIGRINEPVAVGIPFPRGKLDDESQLILLDPQDGYLALQKQVLAKWPDQSLKWVLLDFQVSVKANTTKELRLHWEKTDHKDLCSECVISINNAQDSIEIDTKAAFFSINTSIFRPFDRVVINGTDLLSCSSPSKVVLTDETGTELEPVISNIYPEVKGKLRATLKVEGKFKSSSNSALAAFFSRISFFANSSLVKVDFTILNPKAAKHPGGIWDLGDPGSTFFRDLSLFVTKIPDPETIVDWKTQADGKQNHAKVKDLVIYQDSSGSENWNSLNHINRNGEVKNSFRGYRVYSGGKLIEENLRANPTIALSAPNGEISGAVRHFWQNFPKAIEANDTTLTIRLFPHQYEDVFELQGGEQKTHTIFLHFASSTGDGHGLEWIQYPLLPRSTPEWYAHSRAISYVVPEGNDPNKDYINHINRAIRGENTFFDRREIIDEYGWRHFGEIYADHEAIGHKGPQPLVSHYNNQYDGGIYGALIHYVRSGDSRWFTLADDLCSHVRDIDIYHTDNDRPEYNRGLFWHTEHYIDAATSTHRCFSKYHLKYRNAATYGGGPSLSHVYTTGLLYHYYLTGNTASRDAVEELASYVVNNIDMEETICCNLVRLVKRIKGFVRRCTQKNKMPQYNEVYGLNGPGRASGNALNTLIDAFLLTEDSKYLYKAEGLILQCIQPADDIKKRDLLDIENRWMYTVFLQALGKYLDLKRELNQIDDMYCYARGSLLHYARWMLENEYPYLETPDKLEYPNETWAAQELRKSNVFKYAAQYSENEALGLAFIEKSRHFFRVSMEQLASFPSRYLTRPIVILMVNGYMQSFFELYFQSCEKDSLKSTFHGRRKKITVWSMLRNISMKQEIRYLLKLFS